MTVKELIQKLENENQNAIVIVHGHSDGSGFDEVTKIERKQILPSKESWQGGWFERKKRTKLKTEDAICLR